MCDRTKERNIAIQVGLVLLLVQLLIKTLVFYNLTEDVEHMIIPGVLSIYYKNHFCEYLDIRQTTEAWCVLSQTIQYLCAMWIMMTNQEKVKNIGKGLLGITVQIIMVSNIILGYDLNSSLTAIFIIVCYYWLFIENKSLIDKAQQKIRIVLMLSLCMSLIGSIGNQLEQNLRGHVVDYMIAFPRSGILLSNYVFNLEDIYCVIGRYICIVILLYLVIKNDKKSDTKEDTEEVPYL